VTCDLRAATEVETRAWGAQLAPLLFPGAVVGLDGELGAGKTCFVKGLAGGLGMNEDEIDSPTFTLVAEHYTGRIPLYHVDLYRLEGADLTEVGMEEYMFGQGITAIEWFRFLPASVVDEYLLISFVFLAGAERLLTCTARGARYEGVVQELQKLC
jgi:tRNA threonylcarbamoyladenosine biosynthesis protein TsaE